MANIKVEVEKTSGFTKRVLAHDAREKLLIVDKEGVQVVPDHPRVHQLISEGTIKKAGAKAKADDTEDAKIAAELKEIEAAQAAAEAEAAQAAEAKAKK